MSHSSQQRVVLEGIHLFQQIFNEVDNSLPDELSESNAVLLEHVVPSDMSEPQYVERWPRDVEASFLKFRESYLANRQELVEKKVQSWETRETMASRNYGQDTELMEKLKKSEKEWHTDLVERLLVKQLAALVQLRLKMETVERRINPFKIRPRSPYPAPVNKILLQSFLKCQDITSAEATALAAKTGLQETQIVGWFQKRKWAAKNKLKATKSSPDVSSARVSKAPINRPNKSTSPIPKLKQKGKSLDTAISLIGSKPRPMSPTTNRHREFLNRQLHTADSLTSPARIMPAYNPYAMNSFIPLEQDTFMPSMNPFPTPSIPFNSGLIPLANPNLKFASNIANVANNSYIDPIDLSQFTMATTDSLELMIPDLNTSELPTLTPIEMPQNWNFDTCSISELALDATAPGTLISPDSDPILNSYLQQYGYMNDSGLEDSQANSLPSDVFYMLLQQPQQLDQAQEFEN